MVVVDVEMEQDKVVDAQYQAVSRRVARSLDGVTREANGVT